MPEYIWWEPKGWTSSQEFAANPNSGANGPGGHTGIDVPVPAGTPLRAPCDGVVVFEGWANLSNNPWLLTDGGGIVLAIDAGDGRPLFIAGHLSATFVSYGDRVTQGQIVCESGNTGKWTTGAHVHEECLPPVYNLGTGTYGRVNPRNYQTGYWEDINQPVLPYQREAATKVNQRIAADHNAPSLKLWDEDSVFDFRAWIIGSDPYGDGNNRWFVGAYTDTYFHSSAFKDKDMHDLPQITREEPVPPVLGPHLNGIDVSGWQKGIDLAAVPADFVAIKASEGVGWADPELAANVASVRQTDKLVIFYHFARPMASEGNTAAAELAWFLKTIAPYARKGDGIALDWEAENQHLTGWAKDFLDLGRTLTGATGMVYLNAGGINGPKENPHDWTAVEQTYPLWYATNDLFGLGYRPAVPPADVQWAAGLLIWQYTSKGRLEGYGGDLDLNTAYGTRDTLLAIGLQTVPTVDEPEPEPPVDPEPPVTPPVKVPPTADQPITALLDYYRP